MIEWKNEFNSFNSWKGMLYAPWYRAIRDWKDGKRKSPLPPVEASLDPIHECNLRCSWCNFGKYFDEKTMRRMPNEHLFNLITFLGNWGVKAICYGGGGNPSLHNKLPEALFATRQMGMDVSIADNGTILNDKLINMIARTCRWAGISVDASTSETYKLQRKVNLFDKAIENIEKLSNIVKKIDTNCDVAYKFLIFGHNQHEIYDACKLAKKIGVKDFHVRPSDPVHQGVADKNIKWEYNINLVLKEFKKCHELETENFHVYTILHKFSDGFIPKKNFDQCYASPCCIQLCADGNIYLCPDQRHSEFYKLGTHYPKPKEILNIWGKEKHYKLVFETGKDNCKTRCTFQPYCVQCQELFIKNSDPFCKWFI